jgi:DNA/RNA endonuclease YhcR with UshA esterase domain
LTRNHAHTKTLTITFLTLLTFISPSFAGVRKTIADARGTQGTDGARIPTEEADVTVSGIATAGDGILLVHKAYDYTSFYIQDNTGGINVYNSAPLPGTFNGVPRNIVEGDSITVTGKIMQYNGNTETSAPTYMVVHSTGNILPQPITLTCKQLGTFSVTGNDGGELYEGKLVKIKNAKIKSIFVTAGGPSVVINDGTGNLTMFIYNMTDIISNNITLPSGSTALEITGIAGQYIKNKPWTRYYQILVRSSDDLVPQASETGSIEVPGKVFRKEEDVAQVYVYDANVPGDSSVLISTISVKVTSESDDIGFVVTATETKKNSYSFGFKLGISKTTTDVSAYPPKIKVAEDGIITLTYYDAADINGQPYTATYNCYYKPMISKTTLIILRRVFSKDRGEQCEIRFNAPYNDELNARGNYKVTVKIFDIQGREIKRLVDNQLVDSGTIFWDGTDDHGNDVPIGTYIVHVLTRNLNGVKMDEQMKTIAVATKLN